MVLQATEIGLLGMNLDSHNSAEIRRYRNWTLAIIDLLLILVHIVCFLSF